MWDKVVIQATPILILTQNMLIFSVLSHPKAVQPTHIYNKESNQLRLPPLLMNYRETEIKFLILSSVNTSTL
jgi:hypothetical protein